MKTAKIIIGLLFLYGAASEYIHASRELHSFIDPAIIFAALLFLCAGAWLIGSGVARQNLRLRSLKYLKYLVISAGILIFIAVIMLVGYVPQKEIVEVNGMRVNIGRFMKGNEAAIPDENERRQFCICMVTKLTADKQLVNKHKAEFESGTYAQLLNDILNSPESEKYHFEECKTGITNMQWTSAFEKGVRSNLMKGLQEAQVSSTNDIDKYCDCLIETYKAIPIPELTSPGFADSDKGRLIDSLCNERSRVNPDSK